MVALSFSDMRKTEARLREQINQYSAADPRRQTALGQLQQSQLQRLAAEAEIREVEEDIRVLSKLLG